MQDRVVFEYAFIRFVPRVERGEFLNVGVILFCKRKDYLDVKIHLDEPRILAFAKDTDLEDLKRYLRSWELIAHGKPEGGSLAQMDTPSRFRWLTAARSTIIQNSKVHTGLCSSPTKMLEKLMEQYIF
ncbi:MAG: DUF3037 domain-containing protein [Bacteroidota bacterium]